MNGNPIRYYEQWIIELKLLKIKDEDCVLIIWKFLNINNQVKLQNTEKMVVEPINNWVIAKAKKR